MKRNTKIKLSKKTKKQIIAYLNYQRNLMVDKLCDYNMSMFDFYNQHICFFEELMLDIEFYGVK